MKKTAVKSKDIERRKKFWRITMNNAYLITAIPKYSPTSHKDFRKALILKLLSLLSVDKHRALSFVNQLGDGVVRDAQIAAFEKFHEEAAQAYGDN